MLIIFSLTPIFIFQKTSDYFCSTIRFNQNVDVFVLPFFAELITFINLTFLCNLHFLVFILPISPFLQIKIACFIYFYTCLLTSNIIHASV